MAANITPTLIHLTYEALLKSFWRKSAVRQFLRECHITDTFLSQWAEGESKRIFLDRLFAVLHRSDKGKAVIYQMAVFLSEQTVFPDLRNWEDSAKKISDASKAVAELSAYLKKQNEEITAEKEKEAAKRRAREEKAQIQRASMDKAKLQSRLDGLHPKIGTQKGGYEFQDWFSDLLDYCEIQNRRPYVSNGRQIDGSVTIEGTTYLIELKFTASQSGGPDIDPLKAKVESKADNTMGIMVSISGYSSVAVTEASGKKTTLLLMDASHLYLFLTGSMSFEDIIARLRRHASQTGEAYLPVSEFNK